MGAGIDISQVISNAPASLETASNGLTAVGADVELGGTLDHATIIDLNTNGLEVLSGGQSGLAVLPTEGIIIYTDGTDSSELNVQQSSLTLESTSSSGGGTGCSITLESTGEILLDSPGSGGSGDAQIEVFANFIKNDVASTANRVTVLQQATGFDVKAGQNPLLPAATTELLVERGVISAIVNENASQSNTSVVIQLDEISIKVQPAPIPSPVTGDNVAQVTVTTNDVLVGSTNSAGAISAIEINSGTGTSSMIITDAIGLRGFVNAADYSADFTNESLITLRYFLAQTPFLKFGKSDFVNRSASFTVLAETSQTAVNTYRVNGYLDVSTSTVGVIMVNLSYTNSFGVASVAVLASVTSGSVGGFTIATRSFRVAPSTTISIALVLTGTASFNVGAMLEVQN